MSSASQEAPPLIDEADKKFLLKKLWCHGQLLSPIAGITITVWSILEINNLLIIEFIYCIIAIVILPIWSFCSWRSMNGKSPKASLLLKCGIILLLYYIGIIIITAKYLSLSTFTLCLFIFMILLLIETSAYLIMVKCLIETLQQQYDQQFFQQAPP